MRKSAAFTLIELLVVIAIIACLLFPVKRKQAKKSRITACASLRSYAAGGFAPRKKHRFILIELLIVIAIIAIIAILAPPHAAADSGEFKQLPFELRRTQYVELLLHRDG